MQPRDSDWAAVLRAQDGVISRAQLKRAGRSDRQIRYAVTTNTLIQVFPGVFGTNLAVVGVRARTRAAALWAGPEGTLSGWSAAWWWGLTEQVPPVPEITIPHRARRLVPAGISVTRRNLADIDRSQRHGLPVTSLPLSAIRGAVALGELGAAMLDRALQSRVSYPQLHAAYCRQIGWHGSADAHLLMAAAGDGAAAISERMMIKLLKAADIHGWRINRAMVVRGRRRIPDFRFDRERLILEIDGWAWHHQPDRFQADRSTQNDVQLDGWLVLRFTWHDLTHRPDESIAKVLRAIRQRSRA